MRKQEIAIASEYMGEALMQVAVIAPLVAQSMALWGVEAPWGMSRIAFGLMIGAPWGLYAVIRGRWV